jgi:hypothetical protein
MFKDVSIWCVILGIVILMFVHHILSNESLIEGNENVNEEEPAEAAPEVAGDSTVEAEETAGTVEQAETTEEPTQEDNYMDLSQPESVNLTIRTDTAAELQSILLQQPIASEPTTETTEVNEPLPVEEETESIQEPFM